MQRVDDGESRLARLIAQFDPSEGWTVREGTGGMNNTTRLITLKDRGEVVLRVYETHRDREKVRFEHEVLLILSQAEGLGFGIPVPIRALNGDTIAEEPETGKLAGMFRFLPGSRPDFMDPNQVVAFGRAAGRLMKTLQGIAPPLPPIYRPYYEFEHAHPSVPLQLVEAFCREPEEPFQSEERSLSVVGETVHTFLKQGDRLKNLPHQLIHGDLNASNLLVTSSGTGEVSAVLDFEFTTWDLRVMEPAVCLWDLIDPSLPEHVIWERIQDFSRGLSQELSLTDEELELLPLLIQLRSLDVFLHFYGRYRDGVDEASVLLRMIRESSGKIEWIAQRSLEWAARWRQAQAQGSSSSHFFE